MLPFAARSRGLAASHIGDTLKFGKAALCAIAGALTIAPALVGGGNASAAPAAPKWAAVANWNSQQFQVFDQPTREAAIAEVQATCKRAFPAPIDLGSAKLNEAHCPVAVTFSSGQTVIRLQATNYTYNDSGRKVSEPVSTWGVGSTRELAVMDARISNLKKYPTSGATRVVWEARQA